MVAASNLAGRDGAQRTALELTSRRRSRALRPRRRPDEAELAGEAPRGEREMASPAASASRAG
jgi:hypothetical protein